MTSWQNGSAQLKLHLSYRLSFNLLTILVKEKGLLLLSWKLRKKTQNAERLKFEVNLQLSFRHCWLRRFKELDKMFGGLFTKLLTIHLRSFLGSVKPQWNLTLKFTTKDLLLDDNSFLEMIVRLSQSDCKLMMIWLFDYHKVIVSWS